MVRRAENPALVLLRRVLWFADGITSTTDIRVAEPSAI